MKAIPSARKKRGRGRPRIDAVPVNVRFPPAELADLDRWIADFGAPITRPEAVRRLTERALAIAPAKPRGKPKSKIKKAHKPAKLKRKERRIKQLVRQD
jgi:hypothetical protein